jgi:Zn-finger nucleic acid-binding protein
MMHPKELDGAPLHMCFDCGNFVMGKGTFKEVVGVSVEDHVHHKAGTVHDCPGCKGEMSGSEVGGVEFDYCPHCQIVSADRASFSHMIDDFDGPKTQTQDMSHLLLEMDVARNVDNVQRSSTELEEVKLKVDDLFVLYRSGILLSSFTTNIDESLDKDVLGSMMMAITDFVQQSFKPTKGKGQKSKLSSIRLEDKEIAFEHGEFLVVALALSGTLPVATRKKVSDAIKNVETDNKDLLDDWDGDLGKVKEIGHFFKELLVK